MIVWLQFCGLCRQTSPVKGVVWIFQGCIPAREHVSSPKLIKHLHLSRPLSAITAHGLYFLRGSRDSILSNMTTVCLRALIGLHCWAGRVLGSLSDGGGCGEERPAPHIVAECLSCLCQDCQVLGCSLYHHSLPCPRPKSLGFDCTSNPGSKVENQGFAAQINWVWVPALHISCYLWENYFISQNPCLFLSKVRAIRVHIQ